MTTLTIKQLGARLHSGAPYGNVAAYPARFTTSAAGVVAGQDDLPTALQIADVVKLAYLPAGSRLIDSVAYLSDVFTAAATAKLGFKYVDGVDDTDVPQDDDYFNATLDLNALAIVRKTNPAPPVTLPKDAWLTLTLAGANLAAAGVLDVYVKAEMVGSD